MKKNYNVLFLCHHNTARSIIAEAVTSAHPSGKFKAFSAGINPGESISPVVLELLHDNHLTVSSHKPKDWTEFTKPDTPEMDFIISLSDKTSVEVAPTFPGNPLTAHWDFPDPTAYQGLSWEVKRAYVSLLNGLEKRIDILAAMSFDKLDRNILLSEINTIHQSHI